MLSYAPLDDDDYDEVVEVIRPIPVNIRKESECSYLVMFFVFGAIILSMT